MTQAVYEVHIKQEWARANDLTNTLTMTGGLMATTTDRSAVDSGEGTFVWDYSEDACPDTLSLIHI